MIRTSGSPKQFRNTSHGGAIALAVAAAIGGCTVGASDSVSTTPDAGIAETGPQRPDSLRAICGNGSREPGEDCDLGAQATASTYCSQRCVTRDLLPPALAVDGGAFARRLGAGRHPVASNGAGFAVASLEGSALVARVFDANGVAVGRVALDAAATSDADASLAALPSGKYVAVWTDRAIDERDVAMAVVDPATLTATATTHANATTVASQFDADVVVANGQIVVAWSDTSDAANGPDLRLRTFDATMAPLGAEHALAATPAVEGSVALTAAGTGWAAAWRDGQSDGERLQVQLGATRWTAGPYVAGAAGDRPALVALDANHLLAAYGEGTDPTDSGTANTTNLCVAVLDAAAPGAVTPSWLAPSAARDQAAAAMVGATPFVAWHAAAVTGDANGEELWLQPLAWNGALDTSAAPIPLPRWPQHQPGDQRTPALAATSLAGGALVAAWLDLGQTFGALEGQGDVVFEVAPVPITRAPGTPDDPPCAPGQRYCGGACTSTQSDAANCGNCGNSCDPIANATATCAAGLCGNACNGGYHSCSGQCLSSADPATCGASCTPCATPPNATATCDGTSCGFTCNAGFHACGGVCLSNGSVDSCGASCTPCAGTTNAVPTCDGTSCGFTCNANYHACGGACADNGSPLTCGASCTPCASPPNGSATCAASQCGIACNTGFHACGGACAPNGSVASCGVSCTPCAAPSNAQPTCNGTSCGFACNAGFHACGGACADDTSPLTCGGACTPCTAPANATATCQSGQCGIACNVGYHLCGGVCAPNNSVNSCGGSCAACSVPANGQSTCDGTSCGFSCNTGFHACGGACADNSSPLTCGPSCTPCPIPTNGSATCNGATCGVACKAGFAVCNGQCVDATEPSLNPCLIAEANGVFVSASLGSATGDGTRAHPLATLAAGITAAQSSGKSVYACAETYAEAVNLGNGVSMYGYFACAGGAWSVGAARATVNAPTSPAVRATKLTLATRFEGFNVVAPNATTASGSSIGLLSWMSGTLTVLNSRIQAGNGAAGSDGAAGVTLTQVGAISTTTAIAGASNCQNNGVSVDASLNGYAGGSGGAPGMRTRDCSEGPCIYVFTDPGNGDNGAGPAGGLGGIYAGAAATSGGNGVSGASGASGAGVGAFDVVAGYIAANGINGANGQPGSGGGGTAGLPATTLHLGSPGKGGGAGGCAGLAATGGGGGGASIAVLAMYGAITLTSVDAVSANGGAGGRGMFGGSGTPGGTGGTSGGVGGSGGASGSGGGGPSIGIAYTGGAPVRTGGSVAIGSGGAGVAAQSNGVTTIAASANGAATAVYAF